jgi:uncharacterized protein
MYIFAYKINLSKMDIICREEELTKFDQIMLSEKAELVALVGRRRIGKTFLVRKYFENNMVFEFSGIFKEGLPIHMTEFGKAVGSSFYGGTDIKPPKNWFDAFGMIQKALDEKKSKKKKVIFLDEVPWMGSSNSRFKSAFGNFWNTWASKRNDVIVIISGSSTSWIYNEVFNDTGGLFQRVTRKMYIEPFTLHETERFFQYKKLALSRHAILELYLILGGIPFYLDLIEIGESPTQAIDRLFFKAKAELKSEFDELFKSLFGNSTVHKEIVMALSQRNSGLTRYELLEQLNIVSSGNFSNLMDELEKCGFISSHLPFGKKNRDKKYKLSDPFTLFFLRFVNDKVKGNSWDKIVKTQDFKSWSGIAFENTCFLHTDQIKEKLKIGGIISDVSSWYSKGNDTMHGAQIDMLIDRSDSVINIVEMKYYNNKITLTQQMVDEINAKIASFVFFTKSSKSIFPLLISPHGVHENKYSLGFIQNTVSIDDLFKNPS